MTGVQTCALPIFAVVDSVQSTWNVCGAAMNARLHDHGQDFFCRHVAGVNSLIGFAQEYCAAFVRLGVSLVASLCLGALLVIHLAPSITAIVSATLAFTMTFTALVGQAKRSAFVAHEKISRCWQHLIAPIALACGFCVVWVDVHSPIIKTFHTL